MRSGIARHGLSALLLAASLLGAQTPSCGRVLQWKADLEAFARILETEHPAPFARFPKAEFQRRMKELDAALPALSEAQVAARWSALLGALGEEHTEMIFEAELESRHLPLRIAYFADGAHIVAADRSFRHLLGARLERVGGLPLERLHEALRPFIPYGQEGWYRHLFERGFDDWPLLIEAAGLLPAKGSWRMEGTLPKGQPFAAEIPILDAASAKGIRWERQAPRESREPYAFTVLKEEGALLIRLRRCREDPKKPFKAFLRQALAAYPRSGLKRVVVDLRGNRGGSDDLAEILTKTLKKALHPGDTLTALIDGEVFSAGAVAAWRLRHDADARLVGEACGASANHVGAVEDFKLPSGREITLGTEIHVIDAAHPCDFSSPILPDLEIKRDYAAWAEGRDPVLAGALGLDPARVMAVRGGSRPQRYRARGPC